MQTVRRFLPRGRWLLAASAGLLLLACAALALSVARPGESARTYADARARWQSRPFGDYRIVAQDERCTYDVLVRRGKVNSSLRDSCSFRARPVDALFALVERDREVTLSCGARACMCEALTLVRAAYHPQLGYPTEIRVTVQMRPRWLSLDVWRTVLSTGAPPFCGGTNTRTISVLIVDPLPQ
ncbi:MAG: hypothetical protein RLZZ387_3914 [Chloroflexota bacterium]|jgi:hypothetical protein